MAFHIASLAPGSNRRIAGRCYLAHGHMELTYQPAELRFTRDGHRVDYLFDWHLDLDYLSI